MRFGSLETEGGKLFVILVLLLFLTSLAATMHLLGKDPGETGRTLLSDAFSSLMTLALMKLGNVTHAKKVDGLRPTSQGEEAGKEG